tara:strand:+ start:3572 stop:4888 length:1317 start_codon:yes stop_codon:yes gene_type:complete
MNNFKQIMAAGLAFFAISMGANAQVIGGEVNIDGSRDDVSFLGGDLNIRGIIDGDISAVAGDGRIDATVHGDVEFFGGDLEVRGEIDGQVEIAAGDIDISARIGGDLDAAGGEVTIEGEIGGELSAAGGSVEIAAIIHEGLQAAGGSVVIQPGTEIFGDSRIVAGHAVFRGTAHGDVEFEGEDVTLDGRFDGDVDVLAEHVSVLASTRINGVLRVRSPDEPEIADGAMIGSLDYEQEMFNFGAKHWGDFEFDGPWDLIGVPFQFAGGVFAGSAFLLGMFAILLAPNGVSAVAAAYRRRPVSAGVIGFISLAMSPVVFVMITILLALTIVGALLIPLLWLLYFPILFLAFAFGGVAVGDMIFNRRGNGLGFGMRAVSLLLVMAIIVALGVVPGLAAVIGMLLLCIGLGAWILAIGNRGGRHAPASTAPAAEHDNTVSEG